MNVCRHAVFGFALLATSALGDDSPRLDTESVCRQSQSLAGDERYLFLKNWVLPDEGHANGTPYRLATCRIPDNPTAADAAAARRPLRSVRMAHGTNVASPVFELIEAARKVDRLDELHAAVDAGPADTTVDRRHQLALQVLLAIAAENEELADAKLKEQYVLVKSVEPAELQARTPEHTTVVGLLDQPHWLSAAKNLILLVNLDKHANFRQRVDPVERPLIDSVDQRITELPSRSATPRPARPKILNQWHAAPITTAASVSSGQHPSRWLKRRGFVESLAGETAQQLFYQSPLTGDFEITGEISTFPAREGTVAYGMFGVSPVVFNSTSVDTIEPLRGIVRIAQPFRLKRWDHFADFRVLVKEGRLVNFINGVEIHSTKLKPNPDPWVVLHALYPSFGTTIRNVRILGRPRIPEEINLSQVTDLVNWRADYYGDRVGLENDKSATWSQKGDEIVSRQRGNDQNRPSLLIHQRPLAQDSVLSYEFFYEPDEFEVHPALGESVWMLTPQGVRRRSLAGTTSPQQPLEGPPISLKENAWNQVRMSLRESTVVFAVNGVKAAQQKLDADNSRQFGLFRDGQRVQCLVRNVKLRGDWPKTVPPVNDQELAMPATGFTGREKWPVDITLTLDQPLPALRKMGIGFNMPDGFYKATPEGLELRSDPKRTTAGVTEIVWNHKLRGDFDVTLSLADIQLEPADPTELSLHVELDDPNTSGVSLVFGANREGRLQIMGDNRWKHPDDSGRLIRWEKHIPFSAGRFRVIREGGKAYLMYSQDEDEAYRLLCTYSTGNADVRRVMLWAQIHGPKGNVKAVARELTIRAEAID